MSHIIYNIYTTIERSYIHMIVSKYIGILSLSKKEFLEEKERKRETIVMYNNLFLQKLF